jgi:hypothetical protein
MGHTLHHAFERLQGCGYVAVAPQDARPEQIVRRQRPGDCRVVGQPRKLCDLDDMAVRLGEPSERHGACRCREQRSPAVARVAELVRDHEHLLEGAVERREVACLQMRERQPRVRAQGLGQVARAHGPLEQLSGRRDALGEWRVVDQRRPRHLEDLEQCGVVGRGARAPHGLARHLHRRVRIDRRLQRGGEPCEHAAGEDGRSVVKRVPGLLQQRDEGAVDNARPQVGAVEECRPGENLRVPCRSSLACDLPAETTRNVSAPGRTGRVCEGEALRRRGGGEHAGAAQLSNPRAQLERAVERPLLLEEGHGPVGDSEDAGPIPRPQSEQRVARAFHQDLGGISERPQDSLRSAVQPRALLSAQCVLDRIAYERVAEDELPRPRLGDEAPS